MTLKEILTGTGSWLRAHRYEEVSPCTPALDDDGLLMSTMDRSEDFGGRASNTPRDPVVVNTVTSLERRGSAETLEEGFNQLVDQLGKINGHLNRQLAQHEELMSRVGQLPQRLESLPAAVENQRVLTSELLEQLKNTAAKDRQFTEAVERIPAETGRQTDTLATINHQLVAAAETDVQLAESFIKFKDTLDRLNHNTVSNTEGILQMSKTFAASDRYLKYVVSKLNKRYAWTFAMALSVCTAVISALIGIILYLAR